MKLGQYLGIAGLATMLGCDVPKYPSTNSQTIESYTIYEYNQGWGKEDYMILRPDGLRCYVHEGLVVLAGGMEDKDQLERLTDSDVAHKKRECEDILGKYFVLQREERR